MKFVKISIFLLLIFKSLSSMARDEGLTCKSLDLIEYSTENFLKILEPSKKPGLFFAFNDNYICFKCSEANDPCYHFEKTLFSDDDYRLYNSAIQLLAERNSGEIARFFSDVRPKLKEPRWAQIESHVEAPEGVYASVLYSDDEQERLEAIKIMGCKFKIHLQVKPEYIISFINHFSRLLYIDSRLHSIKSFKVINPYSFSKEVFQEYPIIVVYLPIFYESDSVKRSEFLDSFIDAINDCYAEVISMIAWTQTEPRFNYKINDLIYIAGSEGYIKKLFQLTLKDEKDLEKAARLAARISEIYTPDFKFIKGFEYVPKNRR